MPTHRQRSHWPRSFTVRPGDVVFVGAADITRWNRFLTQLLPLSDVIQNAAIANRDFGQ